MTPANIAGQVGDTRHTKVFVGGLPWETHTDTMKKYFEQFGDIVEAVVITDRTTGKSKGYGFVTFKEADAAVRACIDPTPMIDGRRANCNLASLGVVQRSPKHGGGGGGRWNMAAGGFQYHGAGGLGFQAAAAATFPQYSIEQAGGILYNLYGYSTPHTAEYAYPPTSYINGVYGGMDTQYQLYGSMAAAYYNPYLNCDEGMAAGVSHGSSGGGYGMHYPHHHQQRIFQYSPLNSTAILPSHHGTPTTLQSGVTVTVPIAPPIPHR